jgi:hypothetical protein
MSCSRSTPLANALCHLIALTEHCLQTLENQFKVTQSANLNAAGLRQRIYSCLPMHPGRCGFYTIFVTTLYKDLRGFLPLQSCAPGYAWVRVTALNLQLRASQLNGRRAEEQQSLSIQVFSVLCSLQRHVRLYLRCVQFVDRCAPVGPSMLLRFQKACVLCTRWGWMGMSHNWTDESFANCTFNTLYVNSQVRIVNKFLWTCQGAGYNVFYAVSPCHFEGDTALPGIIYKLKVHSVFQWYQPTRNRATTRDMTAEIRVPNLLLQTQRGFTSLGGHKVDKRPR